MRDGVAIGFGGGFTDLNFPTRSEATGDGAPNNELFRNGRLVERLRIRVDRCEANIAKVV